MSAEPHHNGHTFGTPVPGKPTPARFPVHDQLTDPAGTTGFTPAGSPHARFRDEPSGFGPAPAGFGPTPAGFGPPPAGFPGPSGFGHPGPRGFLEGGPPGFRDTTGARHRPNTLAILALVFAFCSPLAGLVLGLVAKRQIAESGERGDGMALAGIVVGALFTLCTAVWLVVMIVSWIQLSQVVAGTPASTAALYPG
jgi:hypothetical protein